MILRSLSRLDTKQTILVLAGALALIAAMTLSVRGLASLSNAWRERANAALAMRELSHDTLRFTQALGYGGFIHHFKKAVLRPDDPSHRDAARDAYTEALTHLSRIEANAANLGVATPFSGLRGALATYRLQIYQIERLRQRGWSASKIDAAVEVSDTDALNQLDWLLSLAEREYRERRAAAHRLELTISLGAGLALIVALAAVALLSKNRRIERERAALETAVRERTETIETQKAQLETALDTEKELNGLQRQFIALVSHEFRTPLAIMDGKAQQLSRRADRMGPDDVRARSAVISRSVKRLIELIECVLSAARIEDGRVAYQPVETDLAEALREACGSAAEIFPDRTIEVDVSPEMSSVVCDPVLMRQVVSNLLSNACKYSDSGDSIEVTGAWDPDAGAIRITVRDSGVGIPEDELDSLCERYFRASTGVGRPGAGIGLHIVRSFVDMHGGRIEVESREGEGAAFHVVIPEIVAPEVVISEGVAAAKTAA